MDSNTGQLPAYTPKPLPDRVTVVDMLYHVPADAQPRAFESRYSRPLATQQEPYQRARLEATPEWTLVNTGWLASCSGLLLRNEAGMFRQLKPTDEERAATAQHVIQVALCPTNNLRDINDRAVWLVHPGESMRGCPSTLGALAVRCLAGPCRYALFIVPE